MACWGPGQAHTGTRQLPFQALHCTRPARDVPPTPVLAQAKNKSLGYVQVKLIDVVKEGRISGHWALQEAQVRGLGYCLHNLEGLRWGGGYVGPWQTCTACLKHGAYDVNHAG